MINEMLLGKFVCQKARNSDRNIR